MQSKTQSPVSSGPHRPAGAISVFSELNFRWFFLGAILLNSATWMQDVTISWVVYDLTASGAMLGTISMVRMFATLSLASLAGIAVDRGSHRSLMLLTSGWYLLINVGIGLVFLSGYTQVWPLLVFSLLNGLAMAVDQPLRQTVLFALVPRHLTPGALGIIQTGWALMRTLGPIIGGFLLVRIGAGGNFLVQAVFYGIVALTIIQLRFPPAKKVAASSGNFMEGLQHTVKNAHTRSFILMGCILRLFIIPIFSVMPPIFAKDIFQGDPQVLGSLLSAVGFGGIVGGVVATSVNKIDRRGLLELGAMLILGLAMIGFAASTQVWMAMAFLGLTGFFEMIFLINNQTLLQLSIPDALRGRVNGLITISSGLIPIGAMIAGLGADTLGPRPTTALLGGVAALFTVIAFLSSPTIRGYRLSQVLKADDPV